MCITCFLICRRSLNSRFISAARYCLSFIVRPNWYHIFYRLTLQLAFWLCVKTLFLILYRLFRWNGFWFLKFLDLWCFFPTNVRRSAMVWGRTVQRFFIGRGSIPRNVRTYTSYRCDIISASLLCCHLFACVRLMRVESQFLDLFKTLAFLLIDIWYIHSDTINWSILIYRVECLFLRKTNQRVTVKVLCVIVIWMSKGQRIEGRLGLMCI